MAYQLKKEHLRNWDASKSNEKPISNDDQSTYISEQSSPISFRENNLPPIPNNKQLLTPPLPRADLPKKQPHTLRYPYNDLPENGIPLATQFNHARKEEKKSKKALRKAPPGQGNLVPLPETNPPAMNDNYYPYWHYYKLKNPDWNMRHRQTTDGQLIPYDPVDPSQYAHEPALTKSPTTSRRHHRKSHHNNHDASITKYSPNQQRHDVVEKVSPSSPKQYKRLEDTDHIENLDQTRRQRSSQQRHKFKTENDWHDKSVPSMTEKPSQDSNNLTMPSDASIRRSKHRSEKMNNDSTDENKRHHHVHRHRHHHHHSPTQSQQHHHHHHHSPTQSRQHHHHRHHHHSPTQSQQQQHHHSHHHHHHRHSHDHFSPSKEYVDCEFQVVDASFNKSERTPYFQRTETPPHSPPPVIYNQPSYLPPITSDYHSGPNSTDYYSIHTLSKDWRDSIKSPQIYKADPQTTFYDRYLNSVIDKKLAT
ncbi:unnamed protein product [Rotaria sp. Silwood2]|nr:unnamed protein product [Rotaria sp. Silwood2]CAF4003613.1 unnamed protein product [Rotaria sp. Silwood2]